MKLVRKIYIFLLPENVRDKLYRAQRNITREFQWLLPNPIFVYQMGRVASMSIYESLREANCNVFHIHELNPQNIEVLNRENLIIGIPPIDKHINFSLYTNIIKTQRPAKVITLVREPISRNISAFFKNIYKYIPIDF